MAAGYGVARLGRVGLVVGEGGAVEGYPVCRQQLAITPAAAALHQQADAGQVTGGQVAVGGTHVGAGRIGFPDGGTDAQGLEQCAPGIVRVGLLAHHAAQGGGEHVGVAARVAEALAGLRVQRVLGGEAGHVAAAAGVEHGHHRGFQRRVLVVLLPGQARPEAQCSRWSSWTLGWPAKAG
ncbi:hypothetical protein D9M69_497200 [compost metagenome]